MKTRKQVLAEFQRMHGQLCGTINGFIEVREYNSTGMWSIRLHVTKFENREIVAKDEVEWDNYRTGHSKECERENEEKLAAFKERFNLK